MPFYARKISIQYDVCLMTPTLIPQMESMLRYPVIDWVGLAGVSLTRLKLG